MVSSLERVTVGASEWPRANSDKPVLCQPGGRGTGHAGARAAPARPGSGGEGGGRGGRAFPRVPSAGLCREGDQPKGKGPRLLNPLRKTFSRGKEMPALHIPCLQWGFVGRPLGFHGNEQTIHLKQNQPWLCALTRISIALLFFLSSFFPQSSTRWPDDAVIFLATKAPEGLFSTQVKTIFHTRFGITYTSMMSFYPQCLKNLFFYYFIFESVVSGGIFGSLFFQCPFTKTLHASAWWIFYSLCQDKVTFEDLG